MTSFRLFRHYIPTQYILLGVLEAAVFFSSVYAAVYLRFPQATDFYKSVEANIGPLLPRAILFTLVMLLGMVSMGLYKTQVSTSMSGTVLRVMFAFFSGAVTIALAFYLFPSLYLGRGVFLLACGGCFVAVILIRAVFFNATDSPALKRRVLIYGAGKRALEINQLRKGGEKLRVHIVGFVHIQGEHDVIESHKVIRLKIPLVEYVFEEQIEEIVVAVDDRRRSYPLDDLLDCRLGGVDIIEPVNFFERETGKVYTDLLRPSWMIFSEGFDKSHLGELVQRLFDLAASVTMAVLAAPVILLVWLALWYESKGKGTVFKTDLRIGRDGQQVRILKFRTRRQHDEPDAGRTPISHLVHKYRLDELPQIFNVLRGDLSFVGPRPESPQIVSQRIKNIPFYNERHRVKPGVTGWAQLHYAQAANDLEAREKLEYDLYYVKNKSLFLDFLVLLQTAEMVFSSRRQPGKSAKMRPM